MQYSEEELEKFSEMVCLVSGGHLNKLVRDLDGRMHCEKCSLKDECHEQYENCDYCYDLCEKLDPSDVGHFEYCGKLHPYLLYELSKYECKPDNQ